MYEKLLWLVGTSDREEIKQMEQNFGCDRKNKDDEQTNRAWAPVVPAQITAKQLSHSCQLGDRVVGRVNSLPFLNTPLTGKITPLHCILQTWVTILGHSCPDKWRMSEENENKR